MAFKNEKETHENGGVIRPPPAAMAGIERENRAETPGWRSAPDENAPLLPAVLRNTL